MRWLRRRPLVAGPSANDIATHTVVHSEGGRIAAIVSVIALVFSAYSLWETSLKQAELTVYVTGVVTYGRDGSDDDFIRPARGFEVFAVPITIANGGARDAAVLSLQLDVKNPETGLSGRFESTYTADASYFATHDNQRTGTRRPKTPFSALVIAGRSAWTGTILFYPVNYSNENALTPVVKVQAKADELRAKNGNLDELKAYNETVLTQNGKIDVSLRLLTPPPMSWLDRALNPPVPSVTLSLEMPDIPERRLSRELVGLRLAAVKLYDKRHKPASMPSAPVGRAHGMPSSRWAPVAPRLARSCDAVIAWA